MLGRIIVYRSNHHQQTRSTLLGAIGTTRRDWHHLDASHTPKTAHPKLQLVSMPPNGANASIGDQKRANILPDVELTLNTLDGRELPTKSKILKGGGRNSFAPAS